MKTALIAAATAVVVGTVFLAGTSNGIAWGRWMQKNDTCWEQMAKTIVAFSKLHGNLEKAGFTP